jgi:hypothetical protein
MVRRFVRLRDWPLRAKLAAFLVVVSIAPLALVALLNVEEARTRLFEHQTALLTARADHVMSELDRFNEGSSATRPGWRARPR